MVKKSKKSKSKRTPLRQKYKILRKVKEHHKKKAKEEKKRKAAGIGAKARVAKDPGIPNSWPFKEQELAALEGRRQRMIEDKEKVREAKREAKAAAKQAASQPQAVLEEGEGEDDVMQRLVGSVGKKLKEFERRDRGKGEEGGGKKRKALEDNSRRAFYREVLKVVESSDVVIQVLDARDPLGCRCPELERLVTRGGSTGGAPKRLILLLNKIDLVPREVVEKWLTFLREELPTIAFKCSVQSQRTNLGRAKGKSTKTKGKTKAYGGLANQDKGDKGEVVDENTSKCLGAETLIQLLKNYSRNKDIKTAITVGVVGLPNVGKSSLINSLKRTRVANVGSTPGVTRALQEVHLDKNVKLLDCPGVVMSASDPDDVAAAALRNAIRIEQLSDPLIPVRRIVQLCSKDALMSAYKIARFADVDEFVRSVAFARGRLKKGGVPDTIAAAKLILTDWNDGHIPFFTSPPKRESSGTEAGPQLVHQWGTEFGTDSVFLEESQTVLGSLKGVGERAEGMFAELPAGKPAEMEMGEEEEEEEEDGEEEEEEEEEKEGEGEKGEEEEEEEVEEMDADTRSEARSTSQASAKSGKQKQNEALYTPEGIRNPAALRAEKKRRKKEKRGGGSAGMQGPAPMEDDYNFEEEFKEAL